MPGFPEILRIWKGLNDKIEKSWLGDIKINVREGG